MWKKAGAPEKGEFKRYLYSFCLHHWVTTAHLDSVHTEIVLNLQKEKYDS